MEIIAMNVIQNTLILIVHHVKYLFLYTIVYKNN